MNKFPLIEDAMGVLAAAPRYESGLRAEWGPNWNLDMGDAGRMIAWLEFSRPRIVVETGTFEGLGTNMLAMTMSRYGGGKLTTHDFFADTDNQSVTTADWRRLQAIRFANLASIVRRHPDVEVRYVDGDTRETLATTQYGGPIDFFFQDTMHFLTGILSEFETVESRIAVGGVVVFDDINDTHPLREWMAKERAEGWRHHHFGGGHGQLWSQRIA